MSFLVLRLSSEAWQLSQRYVSDLSVELRKSKNRVLVKSIYPKFRPTVALFFQKFPRVNPAWYSPLQRFLKAQFQVTPGSCRHMGATLLYHMGLSNFQISKYSGHQEPTTLHTYVQKHYVCVIPVLDFIDWVHQALTEWE